MKTQNGFEDAGFDGWMCPQAKECQKVSEAGRDKEWIFL